MKNRKVTRFACHIGAGIQSKLTFSDKDPNGLEKDGDMDLWPVGIYVHKYKLLVPFTNITSANLAAEEVAEEQPKRGPGRPPLGVA
jgi:hypothetical protein